MEKPARHLSRFHRLTRVVLRATSALAVGNLIAVAWFNGWQRHARRSEIMIAESVWHSTLAVAMICFASGVLCVLAGSRRLGKDTTLSLTGLVVLNLAMLLVVFGLVMFRPPR